MFTDPYLANVTIFAGNFAPLYWAFCNGALLSIAENTALFSLLGTTYGGDGQTTFALPDLRGRFAIHAGSGPGLPPYDLGQVGGSESTTLLTPNLPAHNHIVTSVTGTPGAFLDAGTANAPGGNVPGLVTARYSTISDTAMAPTITNTVTPVVGSNQPISNLSPYIAMNYIICVEGIYPSRN